jgi:hypothetical protein
MAENFADIVEAIRRQVKMVQANENKIGVLSTGEYLAVALVLDRHDLVKESRYNTMLEAATRLGEDWLAAALEVQRTLD